MAKLLTGLHVKKARSGCPNRALIDCCYAGLLGAERLVAVMLMVPTQGFSPAVNALLSVTRNGPAWGLKVEISTFVAANLRIRCWHGKSSDCC